MPVSPQRPHPLPLCRSMRTVAPHPRKTSPRPRLRAAVRCAVPGTRRWAGAATPTQRNTAQAPDRAGRASGASRADTWTFRARFRRALACTTIVAVAGQALLGWLAAIPGRLGGRLFTMNDAEACWRGWQTIRTHGGFGRRYRDPQFGTRAG